MPANRTSSATHFLPKMFFTLSSSSSVAPKRKGDIKSATASGWSAQYDQVLLGQRARTLTVERLLARCKKYGQKSSGDDGNAADRSNPTRSINGAVDCEVLRRTTAHSEKLHHHAWRGSTKLQRAHTSLATRIDDLRKQVER